MQLLTSCTQCCRGTSSPAISSTSSSYCPSPSSLSLVGTSPKSDSANLEYKVPPNSLKFPEAPPAPRNFYPQNHGDTTKMVRKTTVAFPSFRREYDTSDIHLTINVTTACNAVQREIIERELDQRVRKSITDEDNLDLELINFLDKFPCVHLYATFKIKKFSSLASPKRPPWSESFELDFPDSPTLRTPSISPESGADSPQIEPVSESPVHLTWKFDWREFKAIISITGLKSKIEPFQEDFDRTLAILRDKEEIEDAIRQFNVEQYPHIKIKANIIQKLRSNIIPHRPIFDEDRPRLQRRYKPLVHSSRYVGQER